MRLIDADALIDVILNDHKLDGTNANWEVNRILAHIKKASTLPNPSSTPSGVRSPIGHQNEIIRR